MEVAAALSIKRLGHGDTYNIALKGIYLFIPACYLRRCSCKAHSMLAPHHHVKADRRTINYSMHYTSPVCVCPQPHDAFSRVARE